MTRYAEGTSVPVEKSRAELEALLGKHGASQRMIATDDTAGRAIVQFRLADRMVRLEIRVTKSKLRPEDTWQSGAPSGWRSWTVGRRREWMANHDAQAEREAWRRLLLVVKGKLELVADNMSTVEREFLADILLPNGSTVHEALRPQLEASYQTGAMPPLLPAGGT